MSTNKNTDNIMPKRDRKIYNAEYFDKHKDELLEQIICPDCNGKYQKYNKTSHLKTKKHKNSLLIQKLTKDIEIIKNTVLEVSKKIETI
jgi:hypothetical protein